MNLQGEKSLIINKPKKFSFQQFQSIVSCFSSIKELQVFSLESFIIDNS